MHFFKTKYIRYIVGGLLATGIVLVTGFLSFAGMLVLSDSIYYAITAFILAGGVEGEVYAQNINHSLLKIFTGNYLEEVILDRAIRKLIKTHSHTNLFLEDYQAYLNYLSELEQSHDHSKEKEIEKTKKSLKWMRRYLKKFIMNSEGPYQTELAQLIDENAKLEIRKEIRKKTLWSRLSWILNIAAGISCGLVGLEVAESSIAAIALHFGLAISGAALSASVFGLAAIGAIGYVMLIHNTITDMIKSGKLHSWIEKTKQFFERAPHETTHRYILRVMGGALLTSFVVGLGIFATVATAGTWWYAAKAGAQMISCFKNGADWLRNITVPAMAITTLLFNIVNSLKSIKSLIKISFHDYWQETKKTVVKYTALENRLQIVNPIRIITQAISIPFKFIVFVGHLFSMGLTGDKLEGVPALTTAVLNSSSEAFQDGSYFDQHKHHDHAHADILGKFLIVVLSPLYLLSALWDYGCSKLNTAKKPQMESNPSQAQLEKPQLTFSQALRISFLGLPSEPKMINQPVISKESKNYEKQGRIERAIEKNSNSLPHSDKAKIAELQNYVCKQDKVDATYRDDQGKFNLAAFFHEPVAKRTVALGEKIIKIAFEYEETESLTIKR